MRILFEQVSLWGMLERMQVLIVEERAELGTLWAAHLRRHEMSVECVATQTDAIDHLTREKVDIIILDLVLTEGSALAVADYAAYRQPDARVIFVTDTSFFSDGSIFSHVRNAQAFLPASTPPDDLAAMVAHYGERAAS